MNDPKALLLDSSPRSTGSSGARCSELAARELPPERMGLPVTCSDVVFQGALLRCALRDADGGDFVAYLEGSRHDPAARPGASLWLDWRSDAGCLLDPDTAPNATPKDSPVAGSLTAVRTRSTGCP